MRAPPDLRPRNPAVSDAVRRAVARCADGEVPPNVALTHVFMAARDENEAWSALEPEWERLRGADDARRAERVGQAIALWRRRPAAFAATRRILELVDHDVAAADSAQAVVHWAGVFDRIAGTAPDAGAALYALGDSDLLSAATRELAARMREWGLLGKSAVLDLGCGSGRVLDLIAPHVAFAVGADASLGMLRAARRRCAPHANIAFVRPSGRDLALFADRAFDAVIAIDVFPYLVLAGLAERTIAESARVLKPGGHLLMLNYSYRNDAERDRADIARAAPAARLRLLRDGTRDLAVWDGRAFLLERLA